MSDDMVLVEHEDAPKLVDEGSNDDAAGKSLDAKAADVSSDKEAVSSKAGTKEYVSTKSGDAVAKEEDGEPAKEAPRPLQIVSIGNEDDEFAFKFHEDELNEIMSKIPPGWKVAVVSVVGAFRTGKSFLLSWFLRYLHFLAHDGGDSATTNAQPWYEREETLGNSGFHWRGGSDRNTTGIWMWSEPHFVKRTLPDGTKETIAVLLVDSQGMFDNETTMSLTASIFGLSTLLSSYQIYNVDKRIQEDNLQQLALFSEYARMALDVSDDEAKPFQRMEFLVRDWQHFEDEEGDLDAMEQEMKEYLEKVIADRSASDLQETREQISACFDEVSCFGLCHPGMQVTKKKYDGNVKVIEEEFLQLLDRFCKRVFHVDNLEPKEIQGRAVTAAELGAYIKAYAEMFASGAKFPEAATMLEATTAANNTNAVRLTLDMYKDTMNRIAGPKCSNYIRQQELVDDHDLLVKQSLARFDELANFGSKRSIQEARGLILAQIDQEFQVYESLNTSRNPLAGLETYAIPLGVAMGSMILRWIADSTCSPYSSVCKRGSDFLSRVYMFVMIFLMIVAATKAQQVKELFSRIKSAIALFSEGGKMKKD